MLTIDTWNEIAGNAAVIVNDNFIIKDDPGLIISERRIPRLCQKSLYT